MPLVKKSHYEQLRFENERIQEELYSWEEMRPFLELARDVRERIIENLDTSDDASEIGEIAYRSVLESEMGRARGEVVVKYERAHREALYARVVDEIEETEGQTIAEEVRLRLETDPELLKELRDSARKELSAEAKEHIVGEVFIGQQAIVEAEADRQITMDRLDVKFALDQRLTLDATITDQLEDRDYLNIHFSDENGKKINKPLVFEWRVDVNGAKGWVLKAKESNTALIAKGAPTAKFVEFGAIAPDLVEGREVYTTHALATAAPLAIAWNQTSGKLQTKKVNKILTSDYAKEGYRRRGHSYTYEKTDNVKLPFPRTPSLY